MQGRFNRRRHVSTGASGAVAVLINPGQDIAPMSQAVDALNLADFRVTVTADEAGVMEVTSEGGERLNLVIETDAQALASSDYVGLVVAADTQHAPAGKATEALVARFIAEGLPVLALGLGVEMLAGAANATHEPAPAAIAARGQFFAAKPKADNDEGVPPADDFDPDQDARAEAIALFAQVAARKTEAA